MLDSINGNPQMLSDLLIGPSPTCQHGNRKLHRRQLPRNLSPVFRIMKRHPAPAERNHTLRDPLIRLRIPIPDTCLDQPPQKPMMLNKRLQKPIHLRQIPAPEHLLLRLFRLIAHTAIIQWIYVILIGYDLSAINKAAFPIP